MPLAFMPQRVAEIMCLSFAVPFFAKGVQTIVTGHLREWVWTREWPIWRIRTLGLLLAACGTGLGLFGFVVDAEPPGAPFRSHWGGPFWEVFLGVWLAITAAIVARDIWRQRQSSQPRH